ncbi:AzlD family protein [Halomonas sp. E19]|uniref:AzlD family protein n=1 Tax=Halomonas sp. E19 TaxID=3397247 RepID=UPI0040342998
MTLPATAAGVVAAILIMALVTYLTRAGGVFVMAHVPIGPKVERFINAMAGSVLIAVITPLAIQGDWGRAWRWLPHSA